MRFLPDAGSVHGELRRLLKQNLTLRWAVAWASTSFEAYEALKRRRDSIRRMVVGIHFYQTHPDFIAEFREHENVRFQMNPDGVFHPTDRRAKGVKLLPLVSRDGIQRHLARQLARMAEVAGGAVEARRPVSA